MFIFSLMLVVERLFGMLRYLEVHFLGIGQSAIQKSSLLYMRNSCFSLTFYIAAMAVAVFNYFGDGDSPANVPIILILVGYLGSFTLLAIQVLFFFPQGGRHKEVSIPMNVDFALHRNGEWIMLMLGECVFNLLVVAVPYETSEYYATFYVSVLTVILLQYLHSMSQPNSADFHALRRHKNAGIGWHALQHVYSFSLVSFGAAFTFFLTSFAYDYGGRLLADYETDSYQTQAANLFGGSLAIIFFCLDIMILLHLGVEESRNRCVCKHTKQKNLKGIFLVIFRILLLAFTATLGLWQTEPENLSIIGLALILVQLFLRRLGGRYLSHEHAIELETKYTAEHNVPMSDADAGDADWPNVTHARAERS
jgi:hypothetical protein